MQRQKRLGEKDMHTDIVLRRKKKMPVDPEDKDTGEI